MFINFGSNERLDGMGFAPFGQIVKGMEVVDQIYQVGEKPNQNQIQSKGNMYLSRSFPQLTYIETTAMIKKKREDGKVVAFDGGGDNGGGDGSGAVQPVEEEETLGIMSEGCKVTADVRGNLAPPSVVTSSVKKDWLKDRWQAAADMSGRPITGTHWLVIDLEQPVRVTKVWIDYEQAHCSDYKLECRSDLSEEWRRNDVGKKIDVQKFQHSGTDTHVINNVVLDEKMSRSSCRYLRLFMNRPASKWGISVWEMQVWGWGVEEKRCRERKK
jgi:hypothetical protein